MTEGETQVLSPTNLLEWQQRSSSSWQEVNTYQIEGGELLVDGDQRIALNHAEEVCFSFAPSPIGHTGYATQVRLTNGPSITFTSLRWHSLVRFSRDDPQYRAFILALAKSISQASPQARFIAGKSTFRWLSDVGCLSLILCWFVFATLEVLEHGPNWVGAASLAILPFVIWPQTREVIMNRPRDLTSGEVPHDLVPGRVQA